MTVGHMVLHNRKTKSGDSVPKLRSDPVSPPFFVTGGRVNLCGIA